MLGGRKRARSICDITPRILMISKTMRTILLGLVVAILASASLAGCGGGDEGGGDDAASGAPAISQGVGEEARDGETLGSGDVSDGGDGQGTISKAEFVRQADAICSSVARQIRREPSPGNLEALIANGLKRELRRAEVLPRPDGEERRVEAMFAAVRKAIADLEGGTDRQGPSQELLNAEKLADAYGLKSCWF